MKKLFAYLIVVVILIGCGEEAVQPGSDEGGQNELPIENISHSDVLKSLSWIEGVWVDTITFSFRKPPVRYVEKWKIYEDSLSGVGLSVKNGDTTLMESLCIREVNGKINYIARPVGQALIGFPMISFKGDEIIFENKTHDFPQQINYANISADSLQIEISGIIPQGERKVTFKMKDSSF